MQHRLTYTLLRNAWLREALLYVGFFVINTLNSWQFINSWASFRRELLYFTLLYAYAQLQRWWLLPIWLDQHRVRRYLLLSLGTLLPYAFVVMKADAWLYADEYLKEPLKGPAYLFNLGCVLAGAGLYNVPELITRFYRQRQRDDAQRLLMTQMETHLLREQLNPHFLFNTLNNLYGLSLREPDRTPHLLLQLAGLMRYQLDSTRQTLVPLADELDFLTSYVTLETERVGQRCRVEFTTEGTNNPEGIQIAPMLLIPFVENAFKHGTAGAGTSWVEVQVELSESTVRLCVVNSKHTVTNGVVSTGVGLANTRQRLALLYSDRHTLQISETPDAYSVDLSIALTHQPAYV